MRSYYRSDGVQPPVHLVVVVVVVVHLLRRFRGLLPFEPEDGILELFRCGNPPEWKNTQTDFASGRITESVTPCP